MPIPGHEDTQGYHGFIVDSGRGGLWYDIHVWCLDQFGPENPKVTWMVDRNGYFVVYDETLATAFKLRWCV